MCVLCPAAVLRGHPVRAAYLQQRGRLESVLSCPDPRICGLPRLARCLSGPSLPFPPCILLEHKVRWPLRHVQVVRIAGPSAKGVSGGHPEVSEPQLSSRSNASTADGMPNGSCASPVCVTSPFKGADGTPRAPRINLMPVTDTSYGTDDQDTTMVCSVPACGASDTHMHAVGAHLS